MISLSSVAMQLRILWMCVRWDDMATKPSTQDGKTQQTFDTEIVTTEILKHRNSGRFLEQTQYFMRKISIPLDQPRKQVDYSPIRSGLRKRKRAESPVSADPRVDEIWINEEELELCDIRAYRERIEREKSATLTRRAAGTAIKAPEKYDPSEMERTRRVLANESLSEIKQKTEESLREQRAAFKAGRSATPEVGSSIPQLQVRRADGGMRVVAAKSGQGGGGLVNSNAKKIFISKDGKIIGHQIQSGGGNVAPPGKVPIPNLCGGAKQVTSQGGGGAAPLSGSQQKVQIVKSADGKIQVRGLLPGQQLVQMPDGKLQIFSNQNTANNSPATVAPGTKVLGGAGVITQAAGSQQSANPVIQNTTSPPKPTQPSLLPKPNPVQTIQSPSKTYTIQRNPNVSGQPTATPIQPRISNIQPAAASHGLISPPAAPTVTNAAAGLSPNQVITPGKQNMVVGIQSLGANTVSIKDGQLIVQGPDHAAATAIAKQLSTGQAKLANLGGKQVLLTTAPANQEPAPAPVVREPTPPPPPREPTPPPPPLTVTAQLVQTAQGPRIILQGLQGVQLEQQQLVTIQQQVKQQLLRQQALARQQGKVPPTKVSIQLDGSLVKRPEPSPEKQVSSAQELSTSIDQQRQQITSTNVPTPVPNQGVVPVPHQDSVPSHAPVSNQVSSQPGPSAPQGGIMSSLPQSVIKQGQFVMKDGKKVLVLPQNVLAEHQAKLNSSPQHLNSVAPHEVTHQTAPNQSLLLSNLNSPARGNDLHLASHPGDVQQGPPGENGDKFQLTDDYIQETIKNALKEGDLTPELQEKLMSQLDGGDMPDITRTVTKKDKKSPSGKQDSVSGDQMDDEWQPNSWPRPASVVPPAGTTTTICNKQSDKDGELSDEFTKSPPGRGMIKKVHQVDDKRRISVQNRLSSMLFKQKEQLKKEIAKKRALLEKELSVEISREVESLKQQAQVKLNSQQQQKILSRKRSVTEVRSPPPPTSNISPSSPSKKRRKSEKSLNDSVDSLPGSKKDKVYCICKSKYDSSKFYVGCDICSNWFHGSCVGITAKMSKTMSEYVCDECRSAKENEEIYCLCRQPYDESQFYIGCESCTDWFHGRCVGILQAEAESIDEYVCPKCAPNSKHNYPNLKKLNSKDHELIKKMFKSIQQNRNSLPFREPVDHNVNPKYYEIVKEPMDLRTIELRVNHCEYASLAEFIGDVTRIFENTRYFNPEGTGTAKAAENLETFLAQKIDAVREKVTLNK